jgi:hypothetical protein
MASAGIPQALILAMVADRFMNILFQLIPLFTRPLVGAAIFPTLEPASGLPKAVSDPNDVDFGQHKQPNKNERVHAACLR